MKHKMFSVRKTADCDRGRTRYSLQADDGAVCEVVVPDHLLQGDGWRTGDVLVVPMAVRYTVQTGAWKRIPVWRRAIRYRPVSHVECSGCRARLPRLGGLLPAMRPPPRLTKATLVDGQMMTKTFKVAQLLNGPSLEGVCRFLLISSDAEAWHVERSINDSFPPPWQVGHDVVVALKIVPASGHARRCCAQTGGVWAAGTSSNTT